MAAFREMSIGESGVDHPEHVSTGFAAANLFPMLGVQARTGRLFSANEDQVAVLTDGYSEKRFHRDPKAIGKSITLGGVAYQIWTPLSRLFRTAEDDTRPQLLVTARLKPNVSGR